MPDPTRPNVDPNRIDVALQLIGEDSTAVIDNLARQVQTLASYLGNQGGGTADARAMGTANTARSLQTGIRVAEERVSHPDMPQSAGGVFLTGRGAADHAGQQSSEPPGIRNLDDVNAREIMQEGWRKRLKDRGVRGLFYEQPKIYGYTERKQVAQRSLEGIPNDYENPGLSFGSNLDMDVAGMGGANASTAPDLTRQAGEQDWRHISRSNPAAWNRMQEGFRMPQFGEINAQDKLYMGSRFLGGFAERRWQKQVSAIPEGPGRAEALRKLGEETSFLGTSSNWMRMAGDHATEISTAAATLRGKGNYVSSLPNAGVSAGYERGGAWMGMTNPLSEAGREGIHQKWNAQRLRLKGGINGEQAEAIVGGLASEGFVGDEGEDLAFDTVAPLVQQGQDPNTVNALLSKSIRNGAKSADEFRKVMDKLGPAARGARMSLDEYQKSLDSFAESMEGRGGSYLTRTSLGNQISQATTLAPQQAAALMENPLVQGMAQRRGVFPHEMGDMSATEAVGSMNDAVEMAMNASRGFAEDKPTFDSEGKPIPGAEIKAKDRQIDAAAAQLGVNRDVVAKVERNMKATRYGADAITRLDVYKKARNSTNKELKENKKGAYKDLSLSERMNAEKFRPGEMERVKQGEATLDLLDSDTAATDRGWAQAKGSLDKMVAAMPGETDDEIKEKKDRQKDLKELSKTKGDDRIRKAEELASKVMKNSEIDELPVVKVEFTGRADAIFQQAGLKEPKKEEANSGGESTSDAATSPQGMNNMYNRGLNNLFGGLNNP